jgi:5-methyltetrahydrofolate corrinoid/iron sulfur protein methyltransferase
MIIIGERINGMFKAIGRAIREKDKAVIQKEALAQVEAGADILDVNTGPASANPKEAMKWLVEVIQEVVDVPLAIDTPKPEVLEVGLSACRKGRPMINSTTGEKKKLETILPLAKKYHANVVCLTMTEKGIPRDAEERATIALEIMAAAMEQGIPTEDIYLDPIILPVNVAQPQAKEVLKAISNFKQLASPPPQTLLGLSNVSQRTRKRAIINRTFLVMALAHGLDAAILDPLDKELVDASITAELLLNKDIYCDSFLEAYRRRKK